MRSVEIRIFFSYLLHKYEIKINYKTANTNNMGNI